MTTATLPTQAASPKPVDSTRTRRSLYSQVACAHGTPGLFVQVLGLGADKDAGEPFVAAMQKTAAAQGDWLPARIALTGATAPATLTELSACAGFAATEAVGLGTDGKIYIAGSQTQDGKWALGGGLVVQATTFAAGTLTSCLINTSTVFAVSSQQAPWVAAFRDQSQVWQPGYALPLPTGLTAFQTVCARSDRSNTGATHAVGLTHDGRPCEIATASGTGTGSSNWTAGHGLLGDAAVLPANFRQLVLVPADSAQNFHVIGLGSDGSVWDIDTYTAGSATPKWTGQSTQIVAPGTVSNSKVDFFLTGAPGNFAINLAAWSGASLNVLASFTTAWTASNATIPTSGVSGHWQIINNLADSTSYGIFIVGLSGAGLVYELAYYANNTWTAGTSVPISK